MKKHYLLAMIASGVLTVTFSTWIITTTLAHDYQININHVKKLSGGCCYTGTAKVSLKSAITINNLALVTAAVGAVAAGEYALVAAPVLLPKFAAGARL